MAPIWILIAMAGLGAIVLTSRMQERALLTAPGLCLLLGLGLALFSQAMGDVAQIDGQLLAELTLAVLLFSDASMLNVKHLRREASWPSRMLLVGLPLTVFVGMLVFLPLLPELSWSLLLLMAALLAPTDAALGQAVIEHNAIPQKLRHTLLTEAGLNDGLALPLIVFAACAAVSFDHDLNQENWFFFAVTQVGVGVGVGALAGGVGGWLARLALVRHWVDNSSSALFALVLIGLAYLLAEEAGGNPFLSVFAAGFAFGAVARDCASIPRTFLQREGQLLMLVAFTYVGLTLLPHAFTMTDWRVPVIVGLSLFVVRPAAIFLSLVRSGATIRDRLFLGWFGPRGLATALFTLILVNAFGEALPVDLLIQVAAWAVLLSALLHGATAPLAAGYFKRKADDARE